MKSATLRPTKTMIDTHNTNSCIWLCNSKQTEEQIHHEPHRLSNQKNFAYLAEIGDFQLDTQKLVTFTIPFTSDHISHLIL